MYHVLLLVQLFCVRCAIARDTEIENRVLQGGGGGGGGGGEVGALASAVPGTPGHVGFVGSPVRQVSCFSRPGRLAQTNGTCAVGVPREPDAQPCTGCSDQTSGPRKTLVPGRSPRKTSFISCFSFNSAVLSSAARALKGVCNPKANGKWLSVWARPAMVEPPGGPGPGLCLTIGKKTIIGLKILCLEM